MLDHQLSPPAAAGRQPGVGAAVARAGAATGMLVAFYVAAGMVWVGLVVDTPVGAADRALARFVVEHRHPALDVLARIGSQLAATITVLVALAVASALLVAGRRWPAAVVVAGALAVEIVVFLSTTYAVGRDRPDVETLGGVPGTGSFPSGHAAAAVALYGAVAVVVHQCRPPRALVRAAVAIAVAAALLVGFARVYQGLHYATDVAWGWALGAAALATARRAAAEVTLSRDRRASGWA